MGIVHPEQVTPCDTREFEDVADRDVDALGVVVEVQWVDVLVLLRRVLGVGDRAVRPRGEPPGCSVTQGGPASTCRAMSRATSIPRLRAWATNASKSSNVPSSGWIASCPPLGGADAVRRTRVPGRALRSCSGPCGWWSRSDGRARYRTSKPMSAMASMRGMAVRKVLETQRPVVRSKWAPRSAGTSRTTRPSGRASSPPGAGRRRWARPCRATGRRRGRRRRRRPVRRRAARGLERGVRQSRRCLLQRLRGAVGQVAVGGPCHQERPSVRHEVDVDPGVDLDGGVVDQVAYGSDHLDPEGPEPGGSRGTAKPRSGPGPWRCPSSTPASGPCAVGCHQDGGRGDGVVALAEDGVHGERFAHRSLGRPVAILDDREDLGHGYPADRPEDAAAWQGLRGWVRYSQQHATSDPPSRTSGPRPVLPVPRRDPIEPDGGYLTSQPERRFLPRQPSHLDLRT